MEGISRVVVKRRKLIVLLTLLLTVISAICFFNVKINYNMTDYLPENANSTVALDLMEEEFQEAVPNCNVMMDEVSIMEAVEIKGKLENIDGISNVTWLDDVVDIKQPLEVLDTDTVDDYYKEGSALYSVTIEDGKEQQVTDEIKEVLGEDAKLSGSAVEQADSQRLASSQTISAICVLGPLIILILILATTSWLEPFIYLAAIGAAVMVNLGTELFRGEISYVTLAVAPILQMAVSLDYAVFLSSAFEKNKKKAPNNGIAMVWAMQEASKSILASALTTIFGFFALTLMDFRIGPDMGISLVKGVVLSLVACLTFLPAALLLLNRFTEKTKHRKFIPEFGRIAKTAVKVRVPVFIAVLAISGFCYIAQSKNSFTYGSGDAAGNTAEAVAIKEKFGENNIMVLLVPKGDVTKEMLLTSEIEALPDVDTVMSYTNQVGAQIPAQYLSNEIRSNFYGENYGRIIIYSDLPSEGDRSFALVENVRSLAEKYYGSDVYSCGQSANLYDMKSTIEADNSLVSIVTLVAIYIILAVTLKSWFLPILLILAIKASIWVNMSIPFFAGKNLIYLGYLVVSTVQMGATIDYAILLTDHYMIKRKQYAQKEAMEKTMAEVIPSVLVSAAILAIAGFALAFVTSNEMVQALGILIGRGALIPLVLVNLCLPAMLFFTDKFLPLTVYKADFFREPVLYKDLEDEFDLDEGLSADSSEKEDVTETEEPVMADTEKKSMFLGKIQSSVDNTVTE